MSKETLVSIEEQIRDLHVKAKAARDTLQIECDEEFRKCEWLKEVVLIFQESGPSIGCGIDYKLIFGVKQDSLFSKGMISSFYSFRLYGDSKDYQENIILRSEGDRFGVGYLLATDNAKTLLRFLEEFKPKIQKSDNLDQKLKVLEKVKSLMI